MALPLLMAASAAAPIIGGILGNNAAKGDAAKAAAQREAALAAIQNINTPNISDMMVDYDNYENMGDLSAILQDTFTQQDSELGDVATDPRLRQAQMDALATLERISGGGGMTDIEKAQLNDTRQGTAQEMASGNQAIREEMARRGMGGGAQEMLLRQQLNDDLLNQRADQDLNINAMAQQRALDALAQQGSMAGSMEDRDYAQKAAVARANDEINRFNTANRQSVANANTATKNTVADRNLTNRQNISNSNVDVNNKQKDFNSNVYQQDFNNQMAKGQALAGAYDNAAAGSSAEAQRKAKMYADIGQGVGQMGASFAGGKK